MSPCVNNYLPAETEHSRRMRLRSSFYVINKLQTKLNKLHKIVLANSSKLNLITVPRGGEMDVKCFNVLPFQIPCYFIKCWEATFTHFGEVPGNQVHSDWTATENSQKSISVFRKRPGSQRWRDQTEMRPGTLSGQKFGPNRDLLQLFSEPLRAIM